MRRLVAYASIVLTTLAVATTPVQARTIAYAPVSVSPVVTSPPVVETPEIASPASPLDLDSVAALLPAAAETAAARDAQIAMVLLDRVTGATVAMGADDPTATASVVKLFIADDILFRAAAGEVELTPDDRATLDVMLRSSDDNAGESLWSRFGESDIVARVAARYGLTATASTPGDEWWNTMTTVSDLARYYAMLADGSGGLDDASSATIIGNLKAFADFGADGYDQRFGIPDALQPVIEVAVKQGWMCCVEGDWLHLSTGYLGDDERYILVVASSELSQGWANDTAAGARETLTRFLASLFPAGPITP